MGRRRPFVGVGFIAIAIGSLCFTAGLEVEVPLRMKIGRSDPRGDLIRLENNQSINGNNQKTEMYFEPIVTNRITDGLGSEKNSSKFHSKNLPSFLDPIASDSMTRNSIIAEMDKHGPSEYEAYPPDFYRPGISERGIKPRTFVTHKSRRINLPIYTTIYSEHKVISHGHGPHHKRPYRGGKRGRRRKNRRRKRPRHHHHHHGNQALPSYAPAFISYGPIFGPPPDSKSVINLKPAHEIHHGNGHGWEGSHTQNHPTIQYHKPGQVVSNPIFPQHPQNSHKDLFGYFGSDTRAQPYTQPNSFHRENQWASPSYNNYNKPPNPPIYLPQVSRPGHHSGHSSINSLSHLPGHSSINSLGHLPGHSSGHSGHSSSYSSDYPVANHQNFGGYSVNPPNYSQKYNRDLRDHKESQGSYSNSESFPVTKHRGNSGGYGASSYGSPHQPQPYDMPMHFGHPMHNFGPPKSSFGQPPPTYGPEIVYNGHEFEEATTSIRPSKFPKEDSYKREERRKPYKSYSQISAPERPERYQSYQSDEPEIYRKKKKPKIHYYDDELKDNNYRDEKSYNNYREEKRRPKYAEGPSGPSHFRDSPRDSLRDTYSDKRGKYGKKSKGRFTNFYEEPYGRGTLDSESYERPIKYPKHSYNKYEKYDGGELRMEKFKERDVIHVVPGPSSTSGPSNSIKYQKGRPPPQYDTNYNSPGMSMDPKGVDWMPWDKDKSKSETVASSYPGNVSRKPLKYSTLPYSMEDHTPDPRHTKLPKLTYSVKKIGRTPEYFYENIEESKVKERIKPPDSPMSSIKDDIKESEMEKMIQDEKERDEVTKTPLAVSLPQVFLDKQMSRKILLQLESKRNRKRSRKISSP